MGLRGKEGAGLCEGQGENAQAEAPAWGVPSGWLGPYSGNWGWSVPGTSPTGDLLQAQTWALQADQHQLQEGVLSCPRPTASRWRQRQPDSSGPTPCWGSGGAAFGRALLPFYKSTTCRAVLPKSNPAWAQLEGLLQGHAWWASFEQLWGHAKGGHHQLLGAQFLRGFWVQGARGSPTRSLRSWSPLAGCSAQVTPRVLAGCGLEWGRAMGRPVVRISTCTPT